MSLLLRATFLISFFCVSVLTFSRLYVNIKQPRAHTEGLFLEMMAHFSSGAPLLKSRDSIWDWRQLGVCREQIQFGRVLLLVLFVRSALSWPKTTFVVLIDGSIIADKKTLLFIY